MEAEGLLSDAPRCVYVELGAGKGWLSAWLAGASGARHLVLLDRQAAFAAKVGGRRRGGWGRAGGAGHWASEPAGGWWRLAGDAGDAGVITRPKAQERKAVQEHTAM